MSRRHSDSPERGAKRSLVGRETGASVVEAAMVAPLFLLLVFGIIEGGAFFYNINSVRNAARESAREASTWASSALADRNALGLALRGLTASGSRLEGVIIYKANGPTDGVPADCLTALAGGTSGVAGLCNVYSAVKMRTLDDSHFGAELSSPPGYWDASWPPTQRNDSLTPTQNPDFVGVHVRVKHVGITGILPYRLVSGTAVFRIEPQRSSG